MADQATVSQAHIQAEIELLRISVSQVHVQVEIEVGEPKDYIADSVGVTDALNIVHGTAGHEISIADEVGVADDSQRTAETQRTPADNVGIADDAQPSTIAGEDHEVSVSESVGVSDELAIYQGIPHEIQIADIVGATDVAVPKKSKRVQVSDDVGVTDVEIVPASVTQKRVVADVVWEYDRRPTVSRDGTIILSDSVGVRDSVLPRGLVKAVVISDTVGIVDSGPGALGDGTGGDTGGGVGGRVGVPGPTLPGGSPFPGGTTIGYAMELLK